MIANFKWEVVIKMRCNEMKDLFPHQIYVAYVLPEAEKAVWAAHTVGKEKSKEVENERWIWEKKEQLN